MDRSRIVVLVLATAVVLGLPAPSSASDSYCSGPVPPPCIVSATVNGTPVPADDPNWSVEVDLFTGGGSNDLLWQVLSVGTANPFVLGPASLDDVWVITIDTGTVVPRVAFTHGTAVDVNRVDDGDGTYRVTITATPVVMTGECDQSVWPWTCPETASMEWDGYLDGNVTDYGAWDDVAQRNSMYGLDYSTNVSATSVPPEIVNDPGSGHEQLLIRLANPHFRMDGTTVFEGFVHQRIPNAFLSSVYGLDDPSSLTSSGLDPVVTGPGAVGTTSVVQEPGGAAMLVDIEGLTFSARKVRIGRGVVTPTRPENLDPVRSSPTRGRLRFGPSDPRGSEVTGYRGRCEHGSTVVTAKRNHSPIVMRGLRANTRYSCRVRGLSDAGPGPWSPPARLRARP
jgi:hypothetical protein